MRFLENSSYYFVVDKLYQTIYPSILILFNLPSLSGRIVNVTSVKGLCVSPNCAAYCITKFGLEAFSDSLRIEMEQFGISISIIEPCNFGGITGCLNEPAVSSWIFLEMIQHYLNSTLSGFELFIL